MVSLARIRVSGWGVSEGGSGGGGGGGEEEQDSSGIWFVATRELTSLAKAGPHVPEMLEMWIARRARSCLKSVRSTELISRLWVLIDWNVKELGREWIVCSVCVRRRLGIVARWSTAGL